MAEPSGPYWVRLLPDRIATQIALVVVVSVLLLHAAVSIMVLSTRRGPMGEHPAEMTGRVAGFIQMLDVAPLSERAGLLARMMQASPGTTFSYPAAITPATQPQPDPRARHLRRLLGGLAVGAVEQTDQPGRVRIPITLTDGTAVAVILPVDRPPGPPPRLGGALIATAIFLLLILILLGTWTVLFLLRPLRAMEAAVESYGPDGAPEPLPESGPREIRTVAKAINRMQERIARLLEDRTRTLAAVGHDLRTPITRLRLRAELFEDTPERARMLADLDQMDAMVQSALAHLRDGRGTGHLATFDLHSLLQTIADRYQDIGKPVTMAETGRVAVRGRPLDIDRAVSNIVDNALKYGTSAAIALTAVGGEAVVEVMDEGPGIPAERRDAMLQPFMRGEEARTMNDADGFGLGLAITRAIVEAHGGTIAFADRQPWGFIVRVSLPVA
jgi:signal transduction histidine kinase